jgi:hypothetical protein
MSFGSRGIGLLVLLSGAPVLAQRVVVFELDGDAGGRLRAQVEAAVARAGTVTVVPLGRYRAAAAKRKLKGPVVFTGTAVSRVSKALRLDAVIGGGLEHGTYHVLIYDRSGQELWTKDLPLKEGLLSDELVVRLARAIGAAGAQGAARSVDSAPVEQADAEPGACA